MSAQPPEQSGLPPRVTVPEFAARKGVKPIVMVTAYDAWQARLADGAGVDSILVGDSLGMTTLAQTDTLSVTLDAMTHHTRAVSSGQQSRRLAKMPTTNEHKRGARRALLVADMPFGTYGASVEQGVLAAVALMQSGAQAVKLEGAGQISLQTIRQLTEIGVPVMGHIGMTPQSSNQFGGFKTQGGTDETADRIRRDLDNLVTAGIFAVVLELIPDVLARLITAQTPVATIGIGAGAGCDGQVQVLHDILGLSPGTPRRHTRRYLEGAALIENAIAEYAGDVREKRFPAEENTE